jgi:UDP-N-acetylglucosamine:LPS N-acetylglucosamine transferase
MPTEKKWLFYYLKTGGGHLSPARALKSAVEKIDNHVDVRLIDGLQDAIKPAHWIIEDGYRISMNYAKWTFELLYAFNMIGFFGKLSNRMFASLAAKNIEKELREQRPDKLIIFHYFLIQPVYIALEKLNLQIPVTVVVTDPYTAHPIWFRDKRPDFIVFSDALRDKLTSYGFEKNKVFRFPQIINPKFERVLSKQERLAVFEKLGLDPGLKTILIFGGGDGMKKGIPILKSLTGMNKPVNILMVCGRNTLMYRRAKMVAQHSGRAVIKVFGFVDNMEEYLAVANVVISKGGASAMAEMLITKKIPVVVDYIWAQEKGNVDFILNNHLGFYEPGTRKMTRVVSELLYETQLFDEIRQNLINMNYRNGVHQIAEFVLGQNQTA